MSEPEDTIARLAAERGPTAWDRAMARFCGGYGEAKLDLDVWWHLVASEPLYREEVLAERDEQDRIASAKLIAMLKRRTREMERIRKEFAR
jgi:hypothetical protein